LPRPAQAHPHHEGSDTNPDPRHRHGAIHRDEPAVQRGGNGVPQSRLVAAIVDRVTFNAHILETGTQSYRLAISKTAALRKRGG
jgi:hypothetical protein